MATGLVLDETIRIIVREEISKSSLTNFPEEKVKQMIQNECEIQKSADIDNWMDSNASSKVKEHLENNTNIEDIVNDCVTNLSFEVSVS